jgi:hypothetical protein
MFTRHSTASLAIISTDKLSVDQYVYIIAFEENYDFKISMKIRAMGVTPL